MKRLKAAVIPIGKQGDIGNEPFGILRRLIPVFYQYANKKIAFAGKNYACVMADMPFQAGFMRHEGVLFRKFPGDTVIDLLVA